MSLLRIECQERVLFSKEKKKYISTATHSMITQGMSRYIRSKASREEVCTQRS